MGEKKLRLFQSCRGRPKELVGYFGYLDKSLLYDKSRLFDLQFTTGATLAEQPFIRDSGGDSKQATTTGDNEAIQAARHLQRLVNNEHRVLGADGGCVRHSGFCVGGALR